MSSPVGQPKAAVADAAPPPENDSSPPLPAPLPSPETDTNPPSNTATVPPQLPASQPPLPSPPPILTLPPSPFSSLSPPPAQPLIPDPTLPPSPSLSPPPVLPPLTSPPSPPVNNSPLQLLTPPPIPLTQIPPTQSTPLTSPEQSFPVGTPPPLHAQSSPPGPAPTLPVAAPPPNATPETPISSQPPISTAPSNPVNSVPPLPTLPLSQTPPPQNGGGHPAVSSHPLLLPPPPPLPTEPVPKGGSGGNGSSSNVGKIVAGSTEGSHVSTGVVVGLFLGGVVVLILLLVFSVMLIFCRKRKRSNGGSEGYSGSNYEVFEDGNLLPKQSMCNVKPYQELLKSQTVRFCSGDSVPAMVLVRSDPGIATSLSSGTFIYEDLLAATDGFSEANLLGQGGSGYVHKGILPNGKEVAVKQLKFGGQQVEREFRAEVETISLVHHKHLVSLVGYCISGADRLLVYEFVPNKTLEFHLHGKEQPVMEWNTRLRIAIGSAKGLAYLHEDCNPTIIHRDIKAANILLNFNFEAKVSDFGMAKIFSPSNSSITHITTRVVGTFGYVAPEYVSSGRVTDKSDVYSFGVMLLELITGRPPISTGDSAMNGSLVNWARPLLMLAIEDRNFVTLADPRLQNNFDVNEMASMVACAAACVRLSAWRRPRMSQVVRVLEGDLSPSDLNDGIRPGQNATHFPYESSDFDPHKRYLDEMENFRIALASSRYSIGSRCSENASEYGL